MANDLITWIAELAQRVLLSALWPVWQFLGEGQARFYWAYCLTGLIIAAYAYRKHKDAASFEATLLDKNVWASPSAINDYIIFVLIPVLRVTLLSALAIKYQTVSQFIVTTLQALGVSGQATGSTAIALGLALTLALFLMDDFLRWLMHYMFHHIPELWEFHKVHHSAEVLNFATAERHHPLEIVINGFAFAFGRGLVNGIFIGLFGDQLTVTTIAGANIFLFAFNICGGVLRHSPFWISFGPRVERWIISPAMHQIHHSNKQEHFDRNFGGSLSVWDRMAGSLHIPKGREIEGFGIGAETADFRSMDVLLFRPFAKAWRVLNARFGRHPSEGRAAAPVQSA